MAREDPQLKIRLPEALKERVESASKVNGRTMNAEIVAALQSELDRAKDDEIERLRKEVIRLEGETAPYRLTISKERSALLNVQLFALRLAKAIPFEVLQRDPELAKEASALLQRERQVMMDVLEASILNFAELPRVLEKRIASGHLKVVPDDANAPPTKFAGLPEALGRGKGALETTLSQLDDEFLIELFDRPAVRAALHPIEKQS